MWWAPVVATAVFVVFVVIRRLPPASRVRRTVGVATARVGMLVGLAMLVRAAVVQTPWVQQERIVTQDDSLVGYVLSVDPGYLNVLTEDGRFVIVVSSTVVSRE